MRHSIEHLRTEHERLLDLIYAADAVAERVLHGELVDTSVIRGLTECFMLYVHGIHREKEEDNLFPLLRSKGQRHPGGCVGVMMAEHNDAEEAFATMERAAELYEQGAGEAAHAWSRAARIYCTQLRMHLRRENEVMFGQAERALSEEDDAQLMRAFWRVDEKARVNGIVERLSAAEQDAKRAVA